MGVRSDLEEGNVMNRTNHNGFDGHNGEALSVGTSVREKLLEQIRSLLAISETVRDSNTRLLLQAQCLDLVSSVEELIERHELDARAISKTH